MPCLPLTMIYLILVGCKYCTCTCKYQFKSDANTVLVFTNTNVKQMQILYLCLQIPIQISGWIYLVGLLSHPASAHLPTADHLRSQSTRLCSTTWCEHKDRVDIETNTNTNTTRTQLTTTSHMASCLPPLQSVTTRTCKSSQTQTE